MYTVLEKAWSQKCIFTFQGKNNIIKNGWRQSAPSLQPSICRGHSLFTHTYPELILLLHDVFTCYWDWNAFGIFGHFQQLKTGWLNNALHMWDLTSDRASLTPLLILSTYCIVILPKDYTCEERLCREETPGGVTIDFPVTRHSPGQQPVSSLALKQTGHTPVSAGLLYTIHLLPVPFHNDFPYSPSALISSLHYTSLFPSFCPFMSPSVLPLFPFPFPLLQPLHVSNLLLCIRGHH